MVLKIFPQKIKPTDDPFERLLGHFGTWQLVVVVTISLVKLSSGWVQMAILFLTPNVTFWCSRTNSTADISQIANNTYLNDTWTVGDNNTCYEDCAKYEYDGTPMGNTIISEWDLVCDRRWLASFTQMMLQLGILIGSILFGFLSDRYGRKNTFLISITTLIALGFGVPYSPNYIVFTTIRFFMGVATAGTMVVSFVIVMETVGSQYRGVVGCVFQLPFIFSHMTVPLFAYYFRDWDDYTLALAVPPLIYLGYFFLLTESPRWLVSKGRLEEATAIVKKAAMINNLPTSHIEETLQKLSNDISSPSSDRLNYLDLFSAPLVVKTVCTGVLWLISGVSFFGLNQYIGQTSPDPFISVSVAGAIQIPSNFLAMWLIGFLGRKATAATFFTLGGLCTIALGCVPNIFWLTLLLGSLGVSCASIVATTIYIYTTELYPTVVRNMAMGACSMCMRVGSMLAPFASNLTVTVPWLPTAIFGLAPIFAGIVCLCLPETNGRALANSMEDVKK